MSSFIPKNIENYRKKEYWDERYERFSHSPNNSESLDKDYEWFKSYADIKEHLSPFLSPSSRILVLGCGNSRLGQDLYEDGYQNVVNVDYSEVVIKNMKIKYPLIEWKVADIRCMPCLADKSFDLIIDKGTIDALMCDNGDIWNPSDQVVSDVERTVSEVKRLLDKDGVFFYLTFGQPHFRKRFLEDSKIWDLQVIPLGIYFLYVMRIISK